MKEALIIGLDGFMADVVLVEDTVTGVSPINQITPAVLDENGVELTPEIVTLIGYQVAIKVPEGLHKPKFDLTAWDTLNQPLQPELDASGNPVLVDVNGNIVYQPKPDVVLWVEGKLFDLDEYKLQKIAELTASRNAQMYAGFSSNATGTILNFGFDELDQAYLQEKAVLMGIDQVTTTIDWKTKQGFITLTREQFFQVVLDGGAHKEGLVRELMQLEGLVMNASDKPAVDAILW